MKGIKKLKVYAASMLFAISSFNVKADARTTTGTIKLSELVEEYYSVDSNFDGDILSVTKGKELLIEEEDLKYLDKVDLDQYEFNSIKLDNICLKNGKRIDLDNKISNLIINNSIVNMSTFDLEDYNNVSIYDSYNLGPKVDDNKVYNLSFLNEEYNDYKKYDKKLTKIAKKIKKESNGTKEDLIRLATLYVVNNIDYDKEYPCSDMMESVIKYKKGVCAHYAMLEAQLLRKLGIFSLRVGGSADAHVWNIVYLKDKWYSIDPTWLDTEDGIKALENGEDNLYYMSDIDNEDFNNSHHLDFHQYDNIPKKYLKVG